MATDLTDSTQLRQMTDKVLCCVENLSSFASNYSPLFCVVTSMVKVIRKGLGTEVCDDLDKNFAEMHAKLESVSDKSHDILCQLRMDELNETYGKYGERIKHQYTALVTMVDRVKDDPANPCHHMETFIMVYEQDRLDENLDVYFRSVTSTPLFGKRLLDIYLEDCNQNRDEMEIRCAQLAYLFYIGLIAHMAYTTILEDDEESERSKWTERMAMVQDEMEKVMCKCVEE